MHCNLEEKDKVKIKTIETNRVSFSSFILGGLLIFASKQACPTVKRLFKCEQYQHVNILVFMVKTNKKKSNKKGKSLICE